MKNVDEFTKKSIERELKIQEIKGKKTFKDIWIGDGWLSKNKQGTITFKPIKQRSLVVNENFKSRKPFQSF